MAHPTSDDLTDIALGERPTDEVTRHLATCADCRAEVASLREVASFASSAGRTDLLIAPPPRVWESIAAEVMPAASEVPPGSASGPRGRAWWLGLGLAAAVGLVLGGVIGVAATRAPAPVPTVVASAALDPLDGFATTGRAAVVEDDGGRSLEIDLSDLPATEGYFEVWLLTPDAGDMVSLGAVGTGERSLLPVPAGLPLERFAVVDVSEEAFDGDPTHSAISVARGTLAT